MWHLPRWKLQQAANRASKLEGRGAQASLPSVVLVRRTGRLGQGIVTYPALSHQGPMALTENIRCLRL